RDFHVTGVQTCALPIFPNGLTPDGRGLRLSVLVSPRLDPESATPALSSFPAFERWPDTLRAARYTVRAGTTTVPLTSADLDDTRSEAPRAGQGDGRRRE